MRKDLKVRKIVREIIEGKITEIINYEITGGDFCGRILDNLPEVLNPCVGDVNDVVSLNSSDFKIDQQVIDDFINHITDYSMSMMKID